MKKLKQGLQSAVYILFVIALMISAGLIKYKIWRAEHPQTNTWIFFVSSGK
jgi:hypothetical protein